MKSFSSFCSIDNGCDFAGKKKKEFYAGYIVLFCFIFAIVTTVGTCFLAYHLVFLIFWIILFNFYSMDYFV